ncbi:MAG: glycosyltransferase family 4 protein, partial [Myxococcales bacterium]|nr:glycosyltransferase family 4 protein [Myxococcales bacterium]
TILWDVPLLDGYDHEFVPNRAPNAHVKGFFGLVNPGLAPRLLAFRPDAIVVHGYAQATQHIAMLTGRLAGVPVLMRGESHLHAPRSAWKLAAKRLGAAYLRQVLAGAVAIGTLSRDYWLHYGLPPERVFLAPYAVDNDFFQSRAAAAREEAARWREELDVPADARVLGFAAKLSAVKGCGDLIEAFARARVPGSALVIVGDGPLRAELEAQARRFPDACIRFKGFVNQSQMPTAYAISDVFALPSRFEPWGLAINEAMNLARPVIVSDVVGCAPDLVRPDNGWVFPVGDVDALTAVVRDALSDGERLARMGRASRARIDGWGLPETAEGFVSAARAVAARRAGLGALLGGRGRS